MCFSVCITEFFIHGYIIKLVKFIVNIFIVSLYKYNVTLYALILFWFWGFCQLSSTEFAASGTLLSLVVGLLEEYFMSFVSQYQNPQLTGNS